MGHSVEKVQSTGFSLRFIAPWQSWQAEACTLNLLFKPGFLALD